jgi:hypothetical protein
MHEHPVCLNVVYKTDSPFRLCGTSRSAGETDSFCERDRRFESRFLRRRVRPMNRVDSSRMNRKRVEPQARRAGPAGRSTEERQARSTRTPSGSAASRVPTIPPWPGDESVRQMPLFEASRRVSSTISRETCSRSGLAHRHLFGHLHRTWCMCEMDGGAEQIRSSLSRACRPALPESNKPARPRYLTRRKLSGDRLCVDGRVHE